MGEGLLSTMWFSVGRLGHQVRCNKVEDKAVSSLGSSCGLQGKFTSCLGLLMLGTLGVGSPTENSAPRAHPRPWAKLHGTA